LAIAGSVNGPLETASCRRRCRGADTPSRRNRIVPHGVV
jgi:hypothetical protein